MKISRCVVRDETEVHVHAARQRRVSDTKRHRHVTVDTGNHARGVVHHEHVAQLLARLGTERGEKVEARARVELDWYGGARVETERHDGLERVELPGAVAVVVVVVVSDVARVGVV